jgi:putative methionine-R-sulfoxide reductase with GAF domain
MQTMTLNPKPEMNLLERHRRNAVLLLSIIGVVYLLVIGVYGVAYQQQPAWQFLAGLGTAIALCVAAFSGVWLSRMGRPYLGVMIYQPVVWVLYPLSAMLVAGLGLPAGLSVLLASAPLAFSTLPRRLAWWTMLPALLSGVATILIDLYGPPGRPAVPAFSASISFIATIAVIILVIVGGGLTLIRNINNFSFAAKFVVIAVLFTLPMVVATGLLVLTQLDRIDKYGYREKSGTQYLRPLQGILSEMAVYDWLTLELAADGVEADAVSRTQARIDEHFQQLAQLDAASGQTLRSSVTFQKLRLEWEAIKASDLNGSTVQRRAQYQAFTANVGEAIALVGDTSFLILDPDIATYYLMDGILLAIPEQQAAISRLLKLKNETTAEQPSTLDEQAEMIIVAEELQTGIARLQRNLETATNRQGPTYERLIGPLNELTIAVSEVRLLLQRRIGTAEGARIEPAAFAAAANRLQTANNRNYELTSLALETGIEERINFQTGQMWTTVGLALGAEILAVVVGYFLIRAISRPMRDLTRATGQLASGDLGVRVGVRQLDEVGRLALAFNDMAARLQLSQSELAERNRALAASAEVSRRLSTLLDEAQLVREVVEQIQQAFGYYHAHIYLLDGPRENLVMAGGTGPAGAALLARGHALKPGRGLVGRAATTNAPVVVPDTALDPDWLPNPLLPDTRAEVAVPIAQGAEVLGVLDVQHNVVNGLKATDAELLQAIANQVAIALQNARSYARTRNAAEREALVNSISRKIQSAASLETVLDIAARELGQALNARSATVEINLRPRPAPIRDRAANGQSEN